MLSRLHISSFVGLTIVAWLIALWAQGTVVLTADFVQPFSIVVGIIVIIVTVFNRYAWAWKVLQGWYVKQPDLRGTWKVELQSDWIDPKTEEGIPPATAYMVIRQSLTTLSMRLMMPKSRSKLIAHSITQEGDGLYRIAAIYRNEPSIELQGVRSEIHHGSWLLETYDTPPHQLEGHYWTDRGTRGTINLSNRRKELFSSYEQANDEFGE